MIDQLQCILTVERKDEGAVTEFRAMQTEIPTKKREGILSTDSPIAALRGNASTESSCFTPRCSGLLQMQLQ